MHDLAGRTVLVTGASGTLGAATTAAFQRAGARTVLVERSLARLEAAHGHLGPERALLLDADLTDPDGVRDAVARALARFGAVDALVNTVGGFRAGKPVHEEELETWDLLQRLNVRTTLLCCRAVLPAMLRARRGAIVNVASRDALAGPAGAAAYAASKAAVVRLTESLAAETRPYGVRVNCVLPDALDTPQNRATRPASRWDELVPADAAADAIVLLASHAARAVSGAAIPLGAPARRDGNADGTRGIAATGDEPVRSRG
ncbi:MAG: SDR family NAD(P)-dependent oxidoreductase [Thermodesulfobacteriota bacterium]